MHKKKAVTMPASCGWLQVDRAGQSCEADVVRHLPVLPLDSLEQKPVPCVST